MSIIFNEQIMGRAGKNALHTAGRAFFHFNLVILDFNIVILVQNDYIESPDDAIEFFCFFRFCYTIAVT